MKIKKQWKIPFAILMQILALVITYFLLTKLETSEVKFIVWFLKYKYSAAIVLLLLETFAITATIRFVTIPTLDNNREDHGTSNWETQEEFEKDIYTWDFKQKPPEGGIFVGAELDDKGKPIKQYHVLGAVHSLIIAATRSGKTRRIILQTVVQIARSGESLVINDPKGELYLITYPLLKLLKYKTICLDFRNPLKSNKWNPLYIISRFFKANMTSAGIDAAWDLSNILVPSQEASKDSIFVDAAQSLLAGAIIYICLESKNEKNINMPSLTDLLMDLSDQSGDTALDNVVKSLPRRHPARKAWATAYSTSSALRASVFANAISSLRLYSDPSIETMTATTDHDMKMVGKEKTAVFTIIPDEKSTRHGLAVTYHAQLYQVLVQTATELGGKLLVPVHYIMDEFGNMPIQPDMGAKITAAASRGIKYVLVLQDLQQLRQYGEHIANTILANLHIWLYISTNNPATSEVIAKKLGKATIETIDISFDDPLSLIPKERRTLTERDLKTQDELLRWKNDQVILMPQGRKPSHHKIVDISLYPYHDDFELEGDQEVDAAILHHRENMRYINKEIAAPVFNLQDHIDTLKREIYDKYKGDMTVKQLVAEYQIPIKIIKKYIRQLEPKKKKEEIEITPEYIEEMIQAIEELEEENNILRKTATIFSKKKNSI